MKLLRYSNKLEKTYQKNPDLHIELFKKNIQEKLKEFEAKSQVRDDRIEFERIVRNTTHSGENKKETLKILRKGSILIEKSGVNKIQIIWEVKLDTLLFLSIMTGLVIGLVAGLAGSTIVLSIITGMLFSIITYTIGYSVIKMKIDKMVETCL